MGSGAGDFGTSCFNSNRAFKISSAILFFVPPISVRNKSSKSMMLDLITFIRAFILYQRGSISIVVLRNANTPLEVCRN
jgi:hypothetical protein